MHSIMKSAIIRTISGSILGNVITTNDPYARFIQSLPLSFVQGSLRQTLQTAFNGNEFDLSYIANKGLNSAVNFSIFSLGTYFAENISTGLEFIRSAIKLNRINKSMKSDFPDLFQRGNSYLGKGTLTLEQQKKIATAWLNKCKQQGLQLKDIITDPTYINYLEIKYGVNEGRIQGVTVVDPNSSTKFRTTIIYLRLFTSVGRLMSVLEHETIHVMHHSSGQYYHWENLYGGTFAHNLSEYKAYRHTYRYLLGQENNLGEWTAYLEYYKTISGERAGMNHYFELLTRNSWFSLIGIKTWVLK